MEHFPLPSPHQTYIVGTPWVSGALHLFPILAREQTTPSVVAFVDAPPGALARELPDVADVNQIEIVNDSDRVLVLFDGDAILGCKQDRIADGTWIIPAKSVERVRVCCIERGRWAEKSTRFAAADFRAPVSLRRNKATSRGRGVNVQQRVWRDVDATLERTGVFSITSTLTAAFEASAPPDVACCAPHPAQVGVVVAIGARLEGIDLYDAPETYAAQHRRLVRSYALDAQGARLGRVSVREVERFLSTLFSAPRRVDPSASGATHGARYTLHAPREVEGHALIVDGRLAHLSACTPTHETLVEAEGERAPRTSVTDPLTVSWVAAEVPGLLGLTFAPGKSGDSLRGPRWLRDLDADLVRLRSTYAVDTLVCLLSDRELRALGIERYEEAVRAHGLELLRLPIEDGSVPDDRRALDRALGEALTQLRDGRHVVVHCRGGLGRAGTFGACLLAAAGLSGNEALARVRAARGPRCPENETQRAFVHAYATGAMRSA